MPPPINETKAEAMSWPFIPKIRDIAMPKVSRNLPILNLGKALAINQ